MAYVVTQSCCADASCVIACPVNCIHPTPGEPGFAEAEMLYVDANSCVGCGACATACPVDAVLPDSRLTPGQQPFVALNAAYYDVFPHADRRPLAPVAPQRRLRRPGPFRVAVVGAGPAGMYAADELLKHPGVSVDVYDRLPTPYGLVRAGVAPDHPATKHVIELFTQIEDQPGFRYFLGVEIGRDLSLEELAAQYHGLVYAVGAASDRPLGVEGEDLVGSLSATELVGWYNGHPDHQDLRVPLDTDRMSSGRVVVVGNGNVALDVARILTADAATLDTTDIARLPADALRRSRVREVVVLGRRGPAESAFTVPELIGLAALRDVDVVVDGPVGEPAAGADPGTVQRLQLLAELAARPRTAGRRRIVLRFLSSPVRILGEGGHVSGVEVVSNRLVPDARGVPRAVATEETEVLEAGLVLRSIGYRGEPVAGLPHDPVTGTVPHDRGRVRPGIYVAGWVKRGPSGFIGTNKSCSEETVERLLDDLDAGAVPTPVGSLDSVASVVRGRRPDVVDLAGWRAIDAEERRRGAPHGRPRTKIVEVAELVRVAAAARAARRSRYAAVRAVRNRR